jgi:hypothetical protein
VRFLFDASLPPDLAHAIRELSTAESGVDEVIHLNDRFPRNSPDLDEGGSYRLPWKHALGKKFQSL